MELNLDLNINFSKAKFPLSEDLGVLAKDIADYIYDDEVGNKGSFRIRKSGDFLLINHPLVKNNYSYRGGPCKPISVTCRSKKCVTNALKKVFVDPDRDVDISYRRNRFSVTITYTYQDC